MPRSKPCPRCGRLAEVKTYAVPSGRPVQTMVAGVLQAVPVNHLEDLDVWECECGWAEDVEE